MRYLKKNFVFLNFYLLCALQLTGFSVPAYAEQPPKVLVGVEVLLNGGYDHLLKGKRIGLITNHTAVNHQMESTVDLLKRHAPKLGFKIVALFAPEHGISGVAHSEELIQDGKDADNIPVYSLHGSTMRPTKKMLEQVDLLFYDIQDIGSRSYTYAATLFYSMEEAAKNGIPIVVLDRPNPINGLVVDGPMMEEKWRSIVGYINVPYCHGMTLGELARFFNAEYHVGCQLYVVPMKGWRRQMSFQDTGLAWIPTSPNIPEANTPWYYPVTGILGELQVVNIGIGYTLPFKVIGAPWIDADSFAKSLNEQNFPGVAFHPYHYQPFYGRFAKRECHGVFIIITDPKVYKPVSTQYLILGMLKSLFPKKFQEAILAAKNRKEMFCKVNGTEEVYRLITNERYIVWKLQEIHQKEREQFLTLRQKYLIY
ncbi:MAG: hypothetical protein K940chlam7_00353 [Chlamydiae bacterium]|nr:hypothetical protein [Chlamydiota bacterium]